MVKRQTVWLSTMMVLSLMLIGYYTMNNQTTPTTVGTGPSVATTTDTSVAGQSGSTAVSGNTNTQSTTSSTGSTTSGAATTTGAKATSATTTSAMSSTDWYATQATDIQQNFSEKMNSLEAVIANTNSSQSQLTEATQSLSQLQNLQGDLENATDAVLSAGYKECVIVPDATGTTFDVYVNASKLSSTEAVQIMNTVSTTMDVPMDNVRVTQH